VVCVNGLSCPICHKEVFSDAAGKGCKLCGMELADESKDYCCAGCRTKHSKYTSKTPEIKRARSSESVGSKERVGGNKVSRQ